MTRLIFVWKWIVSLELYLVVCWNWKRDNGSWILCYYAKWCWFPYLLCFAWAEKEKVRQRELELIECSGSWTGNVFSGAFLRSTNHRLLHSLIFFDSDKGVSWMEKVTFNFIFVGCGGEIREATSITSPGHPFTSAPNMNCTWIIQAPTGKVVRFK